MCREVEKKKKKSNASSLFLSLLSRSPSLSLLSPSPYLLKHTAPVVWSECACVKKYVGNSGDWKRKPSTSALVPAILLATRLWSAIPGSVRLLRGRRRGLSDGAVGACLREEGGRATFSRGGGRAIEKKEKMKEWSSRSCRHRRRRQRRPSASTLSRFPASLSLSPKKQQQGQESRHVLVLFLHGGERQEKPKRRKKAETLKSSSAEKKKKKRERKNACVFLFGSRPWERERRAAAAPTPPQSRFFFALIEEFNEVRRC